MCTRWLFVFLATLVASSALVLRAQDMPATDAQERERLVRVSRALESDPCAKDAPERRRWASAWLTDHPELDFSVCTALLAPLIGSMRKHSSEVYLQMIISSGAFVIEHPEMIHDNDAVFLAGLDGSLNVYDSLMRQHAMRHWGFLENLLDRRDDGTLKEYVDSRNRHCK